MLVLYTLTTSKNLTPLVLSIIFLVFFDIHADLFIFYRTSLDDFLEALFRLFARRHAGSLQVLLQHLGGEGVQVPSGLWMASTGFLLRGVGDILAGSGSSSSGGGTSGGCGFVSGWRGREREREREREKEREREREREKERERERRKKRGAEEGGGVRKKRRGVGGEDDKCDGEKEGRATRRRGRPDEVDGGSERETKRGRRVTRESSENGSASGSGGGEVGRVLRQRRRLSVASSASESVSLGQRQSQRPLRQCLRRSQSQILHDKMMVDEPELLESHLSQVECAMEIEADIGNENEKLIQIFP
jgi:hypothetical protein